MNLKELKEKRRSLVAEMFDTQLQTDLNRGARLPRPGESHEGGLFAKAEVSRVRIRPIAGAVACLRQEHVCQISPAANGNLGLEIVVVVVKRPVHSGTQLRAEIEPSPAPA